MVTIQCDYFGSRYMQTSEKFTFIHPNQVKELFTEREIINDNIRV